MMIKLSEVCGTSKVRGLSCKSCGCCGVSRYGEDYRPGWIV